MIQGHIGHYVWVFCIERILKSRKEVEVKFVYLTPQEGTEYGTRHCEGLLNIEKLLKDFIGFYNKKNGEYVCTLLAYYYKKDWYQNFDPEKTPERLLELRRERITSLRTTRTSHSLDSETMIEESPIYTLKENHVFFNLHPRKDK